MASSEHQKSNTEYPWDHYEKRLGIYSIFLIEELQRVTEEAIIASEFDPKFKFDRVAFLKAFEAGFEEQAREAEKGWSEAVSNKSAQKQAMLIHADAQAKFYALRR